MCNSKIVRGQQSFFLRFSQWCWGYEVGVGSVIMLLTRRSRYGVGVRGEGIAPAQQRLVRPADKERVEAFYAAVSPAVERAKRIN